MSKPGVADLRIALETRLAAISNPLSTQWENETYLPTADMPYQRVNLLLAEPSNPEFGPMFQENGYLQVSLCFPINNGPGDAARYAQSVREWFYRGLSLAANGLTATINRTPAIGPAVIDGDRYVVPVKIRFFANVAS